MIEGERSSAEDARFASGARKWDHYKDINATRATKTETALAVVAVQPDRPMTLSKNPKGSLSPRLQGTIDARDVDGIFLK